MYEMKAVSVRDYLGDEHHILAVFHGYPNLSDSINRTIVTLHVPFKKRDTESVFMRSAIRKVLKHYNLVFVKFYGQKTISARGKLPRVIRFSIKVKAK